MNKNEVFLKSLEGNPMLFSFSQEDFVWDLQGRIAAKAGVSAKQFVLVLQSRSAQRLLAARGTLSTCKVCLAIEAKKDFEQPRKKKKKENKKENERTWKKMT